MGTGHWAATVHAPSLAGRADGELVGVWGRTPEKARALAEQHGARAMASPAELFDAVDVVAFAVPPDVQASLAVEAAAAGCHLLLEKPIALDRQAADAVANAVADHGVASVVFVILRFVPETAAWVDQARASGRWRGGRALWFGSTFEPDSPYRGSTWRRESGGLWDLGPHLLSLLVPILGPVEGVTASRGPDDLVHAVLQHAGGEASTLSVGLTLPAAAARMEAAVYGQAGWLPMPQVVHDAVAAHGVAVDELLSAARDGRPHACDAAFGRDLVDVLARVEDQLPPPG